MSENELHLERLIEAPPELVFELWSDPTLLASWWCPDGCELSIAEFDVRPGGRWRMTTRSPDGRLATVSGVYREVEPPRRVVFTWAWLGASGQRDHETEVTVTLAPAAGGTRLVLVQRTFESKERRDAHARGWSASFDRLTCAAGA